VWLLAAAPGVSTAQEATEEERLLKAAYIYNFAKFTRWPEAVLTAEETTLNLCTSGRDRLLNELQQLAGRRVKRRSLVVVPLREVAPDDKCHLLYIANSKRQDYSEDIEAMQHEAVLTVSEIPDFARQGGMIELFREKGRIRFIINLDAARRSGLEFSSHLLTLAVVVRQEERP
jgi:hypothetical protein